MAKRRAKKRQGATQPSRPNTEPAPEIQQHPPEVDDSSTKPLTSEFLKELNRQFFRPSLPLLSPSDTSRVAHLAELGGPDLSDLRGYQLPRNFHAMATDMRSFLPPTYTVLAPPLGPSLEELNIKRTWNSQQLDLQPLRDTLAIRRPSVSLSTISDNAYKEFQKNLKAAKNGEEFGHCLIPTLMGSEYPRNLFALHAPFVNLHPFGYNIPAAQPDLYCGEHPRESLHRPIREALAKRIAPSLSQAMPIIPNFFFEYEDPVIAERGVKSRAQYDGAIGSRAIHSIQNYGNEELQYDDQPYTFSATYDEGILTLYAHHVTGPSSEGELPQFHMNLIRHIHILDSRESLIEGITAFRNARDEAKKHRDRFIAAANSKGSGQQEQADIQGNQFLNALQHHNPSSDPIRQMAEFVQQAYPQPAAANAAPLLQVAQPFQGMLQPPAIASAALFHPATQAFHTMLQPPVIASAALFHPATQAFHTMPQPTAAISGDPLHPGPESGQHLDKGPTPMLLALPPATSTPQRAVPGQTATRRKRPGPSQDAPSQPSGKKTRTGRKY